MSIAGYQPQELINAVFMAHGSPWMFIVDDFVYAGYAPLQRGVLLLLCYDGREKPKNCDESYQSKIENTECVLEVDGGMVRVKKAPFHYKIPVGTEVYLDNILPTELV